MLQLFPDASRQQSVNYCSDLFVKSKDGGRRDYLSEQTASNNANVNGDGESFLSHQISQEEDL
jgi:hypothetical protein